MTSNLNPTGMAKMIGQLDSMTRIDAITCARRYKDVTGEWVDWHEFSAWLDRLAFCGRLTQAPRGYDGMATYRNADNEARPTCVIVDGPHDDGLDGYYFVAACDDYGDPVAKVYTSYDYDSAIRAGHHLADDLAVELVIEARPA